MPQDEASQLMMPHTPADAAQLIMIEALRGLTDSVKQLQTSNGELLRQVSDIHTRVVRIEANRLDREVQQVKQDLVEAKAEIDELKADKNRRDGAVGLLEWLGRFGPWLLALALGILAFMGFSRAS